MRTLVDSRRLARPYGKDWHCSLKGSQKTDDGTFSEFCVEEPCRGLGNPQMFNDAHAHLFDITGSKDSRGDNTLWRPAQKPKLHGCTEPRSTKKRPIEKWLRSSGDCGATVACEVLRSGDENGGRLARTFAQTRVESGRSPEWMAKSKPSSTIVAGLSESCHFQTAISGIGSKKKAGSFDTHMEAGKSGRDGHTNDAFSVQSGLDRFREARVFKSRRECAKQTRKESRPLPQ